MISTIVHEAEAVWRRELMEGVGAFGSGTLEGTYSFPARFEGEPGTTPEDYWRPPTPPASPWPLPGSFATGVWWRR